MILKFSSDIFSISQYDFVMNPDRFFNTVETLDDVDEDIEVIDIVKNACKVILFNDEWHTFDEVINQILKAIACSQNYAEKLTMEVHDIGKAVVYSGDLSECLKVSGILEEISLHTQIEM